MVKSKEKNKEQIKETLREGDAEFKFTNEDRYEGHYCAHITGLAWRQGSGKYITHDGHVYEGDWKDDKLNEAEPVHIVFKNNDEYYGNIKKYKYEGPGTYSFDNVSRLTCNFEKNKPIGDIIYVDRHDQLWYGKAEPEFAVLAREHIFSYELDTERGKGPPIHKPLSSKLSSIEEEKIDEQEVVDPREVERLLFAKSFQTGSQIDFEDSDWFRDYQQSEKMRKRVLNKLTASGGSLTESEIEWCKNYKISKRIQENKSKEKKLKKVHPDLLERFLNEKLEDTCPPMSVFYPSQYLEYLGEGE